MFECKYVTIAQQFWRARLFMYERDVRTSNFFLKISHLHHALLYCGAACLSDAYMCQLYTC